MFRDVTSRRKKKASRISLYSSIEKDEGNQTVGDFLKIAKHAARNWP